MTTWRSEKGFTLADTLAAMAVLGLLLASVLTIQQAAFQVYLNGAHQTEAQQNARSVLERIARDIRETTAAPTAAAANSFTFTHPTDGVVTYAVDGANNLTRNGLILIGGVRNVNVNLPVFGYRDANEVVLAAPVGTPANIRRVDITLRTRSEDLNVGTGSAADRQAEITTSARLRNLS